MVPQLLILGFATAPTTATAVVIVAAGTTSDDDSMLFASADVLHLHHLSKYNSVFNWRDAETSHNFNALSNKTDTLPASSLLTGDTSFDVFTDVNHVWVPCFFLVQHGGMSWWLPVWNPKQTASVTCLPGYAQQDASLYLLIMHSWSSFLFQRVTNDTCTLHYLVSNSISLSRPTLRRKLKLMQTSNFI